MRTVPKRLLLLAALWCGPGCGPSDARDSTATPSDSISTLLQQELERVRVDLQDLSVQFELLNYPYVPDTVRFCLERVPLEEWWVAQRLEETLASFTRVRANRQRIDAYLREAPFYFPYIDSMTAARGLPRDLRYIPVVESEFRSTARSRAKAVGMWQFIR